MAKKVAKTSKKTTKKATTKSASKATGARKVGKKVSKKKTATKKAAAKKSAAKKTAAKKAAETASESAVSGGGKKVTKKKAAATAASAAPAGKKPTTKKAASKKTGAKKAPAKKAGSKKAPARQSAASDSKAGDASESSKTTASTQSTDHADAATGKAAEADDKKSGRKGITIVSNKPARKSKPKAEVPMFVPPGGPLLGPGAKRRAPLIASGPKNKVVAAEVQVAASDGTSRKSPFNKRKLQHYKDVLLAKRRSLVEQLNSLEFQALKSESGSLSNLPQHSAEQGSDTTEQSISLGMADADRQLIREIDAAVARIEDGTFGLCTQTGVPISEDRLEELPWARLSIEAARANERGYRP